MDTENTNRHNNVAVAVAVAESQKQDQHQHQHQHQNENPGHEPTKLTAAETKTKTNMMSYVEQLWQAPDKARKRLEMYHYELYSEPFKYYQLLGSNEVKLGETLSNLGLSCNRKSQALITSVPGNSKDVSLRSCVILGNLVQIIGKQRIGFSKSIATELNQSFKPSNEKDHISAKTSIDSHINMQTALETKIKETSAKTNEYEKLCETISNATAVQGPLLQDFAASEVDFMHSMDKVTKGYNKLKSNLRLVLSDLQDMDVKRVKATKYTMDVLNKGRIQMLRYSREGFDLKPLLQDLGEQYSHNLVEDLLGKEFTAKVKDATDRNAIYESLQTLNIIVMEGRLKCAIRTCNSDLFLTRTLLKLVKGVNEAFIYAIECNNQYYFKRTRAYIGDSAYSNTMAFVCRHFCTKYKKQHIDSILKMSKDLRQLESKLSDLLSEQESALKTLNTAKTTEDAKLKTCSDNISKIKKKLKRHHSNTKKVSAEILELKKQFGSALEVELNMNTDDSEEDRVNESFSSLESEITVDSDIDSKAKDGDDVKSLLAKFGQKILGQITKPQTLEDAQDRTEKLSYQYREMITSIEKLRVSLAIAQEEFDNQQKASATSFVDAISSFVIDNAIRHEIVVTSVSSFISCLLLCIEKDIEIETATANEISQVEPENDLNFFLKNQDIITEKFANCDEKLMMKCPDTLMSSLPSSAEAFFEKLRPKCVDISVLEQVKEELIKTRMESLHPEYTQLQPSRKGEAETRKFQQRFGIGKNENLLSSFTCAFVPKKVPVHGRMYLSERYLCFASAGLGKVFGSSNNKVVVPYTNIVDIRKASVVFGLVSNTIIVETRNGSEFRSLYFTSFLSRDECWTKLNAFKRESQKLKTEKGFTPTSVEPKSTESARVLENKDNLDNSETPKNDEDTATSSSSEDEEYIDKEHNDCASNASSDVGRKESTFFSSARELNTQGQILTSSIKSKLFRLGSATSLPLAPKKILRKQQSMSANLVKTVSDTKVVATSGEQDAVKSLQSKVVDRFQCKDCGNDYIASRILCKCYLDRASDRKRIPDSFSLAVSSGSLLWGPTTCLEKVWNYSHRDDVPLPEIDQMVSRLAELNSDTDLFYSKWVKTFSEAQKLNKDEAFPEPLDLRDEKNKKYTKKLINLLKGYDKKFEEYFSGPIKDPTLHQAHRRINYIRPLPPQPLIGKQRAIATSYQTLLYNYNDDTGLLEQFLIIEVTALDGFPFADFFNTIVVYSFTGHENTFTMVDTFVKTIWMKAAPFMTSKIERETIKSLQNQADAWMNISLDVLLLDDKRKPDAAASSLTTTVPKPKQDEIAEKPEKLIEAKSNEALQNQWWLQSVTLPLWVLLSWNVGMFILQTFLLLYIK